MLRSPGTAAWRWRHPRRTSSRLTCPRRPRRATVGDSTQITRPRDHAKQILDGDVPSAKLTDIVEPWFLGGGADGPGGAEFAAFKANRPSGAYELQDDDPSKPTPQK